MRVFPDRLAVTSLAESSRFTGRVWRTDYVEPSDVDGLAGVRFLYEPGARSYWHVHEREQVIIATYGTGLVDWEGLVGAVLLQPGDWWHVEPGVPHWHGATLATPFSHVAVTAGGGTEWQRAVDEADYLAAHAI